MSKVSIAKAAKLFEVSRPTLAKHLKDGKITGEKTEKDGQTIWQIDMAELKRVYQRRDEKAAPSYTPSLHADLSPSAPKLDTPLQDEIKMLQAELKAEKEARALVQAHLDDLRKLLPGPDHRPQDPAPKRGWWPF